MTAVLAVVLMIAGNSSKAMAGAWPLKKQGLYLKLSSSFFHTSKEFNHEGDRLDIFQERIIYRDTSFREFAIRAYAEYGLSDRLTLIGKLPFKILRSKRTELVGGGVLARIATLYTTGVGDFSLLGKYGLINGPWAVSVQGGVKVPLGYEEQPADDGSPLGTGDIDLEADLLLGKSLYPLPAYITARLGYRLRSDELHDQVVMQAETGYTVGRLFLKFVFEGVKSTITPPDLVGQPVVSPLPGGGGALPNIIVGDQDIFKVNPSVSFSLNRNWSLQGELIHIYAGKNTVAGSVYSVGVIFEK